MQQSVNGEKHFSETCTADCDDGKQHELKLGLALTGCSSSLSLLPPLSSSSSSSSSSSRCAFLQGVTSSCGGWVREPFWVVGSSLAMHTKHNKTKKQTRKQIPHFLARFALHDCAQPFGFHSPRRQAQQQGASPESAYLGCIIQTLSLEAASRSRSSNPQKCWCLGPKRLLMLRVERGAGEE